MSSAAPMAIPPTGPAAAGGRPPPERANSLSAAAPSASSSSYRPVVAGGLSPAPSSIFSSASPMTPSPILASALSLPGGRSTGTFAFNPFFSTSPKTFAGAGPLASSPSAAASSGHQRSFSIAGGAGGGKPILVSGFPSGSAVADDDDEYDPWPPTSTRASLGGGGSGQPPFGLPPLRRPSQPVKLPAQLQSQVKPPSASGVSGPSVGAGSAGGVSKPPPTQVSLTAMKAPAGPTADVGNGGPQAGAGRGQGVLRRLSLGANSLLSRPNLGPSPPQPVGPTPTVATATALPPAAVDPISAGRAGRPTARKGSGGTTGIGMPGAAPAKKRGISPTGERILQGHF